MSAVAAAAFAGSANMSPAISTAKRWWLPTLPRRDDTQDASGGFDGGDQHQNCRKAIDWVVPAAMPALGRHWAMTFSLVSESAGISSRRRSPSRPIADRLDPQRGLQFPMRLVVVERVEGAAALQKTEAARVHVGKGRDLQGLPIGDRPPQPLAVSGQDLQAGRLVGRGAHVVGTPMIERAEEIGRGHGPEAQLVGRRPRDQRHLGVDDGGVRGRIVKRKAPVTLVESSKRLDGERIRRRVGLLDPELAEQRKFLARLVAGPDREAARGEAEGLAVAPARGRRSRPGRSPRPRSPGPRT